MDVYKRFEVQRFNCYFRPIDYYNLAFGCGATALSFLTGEPPYSIINPKRNRLSWSDHFMINYLKQRNFAVYKVNLDKICSKSKSVENKINNKHVLLASQMMHGNVASWVVYYAENQYHNFEVTQPNYREYLNRTISSLYLLSHRQYKIA